MLFSKPFSVPGSSGDTLHNFELSIMFPEF